jgi:hypothetical protein
MAWKPEEHRPNGFHLRPSPDARSVFLAGTLDGCDLQSVPLARQEDGIWSTALELADGR